MKVLFYLGIFLTVLSANNVDIKNVGKRGFNENGSECKTLRLLLSTVDVTNLDTIILVCESEFMTVILEETLLVVRDTLGGKK